MELDLGLELISLKKIKNIKPYSNFRINGCGDLTFMTNTTKSGFGYCVRNEEYVEINGEYKSISEDFYFTKEEMQELFIESYIYYDTILQRDFKINQIINE